MGSLIVRADASVRIGTGHVMRCLALAQAWQDSGGRAVFAVSECPPPLVERLRSEEMEVLHLSADRGTDADAAQTVELARERSARWVVADGYEFGADYQRAVSRNGTNLLLIDDLGRGSQYHAAAILNQNVYSTPELYEKKETATELLLGPRYALLRRDFHRWRDWRREHSDVATKVLVTMGGSDPENATLKVLQALEQLAVESLEVKVVAGAANPHHDALSLFIAQSRFGVELTREGTDLAGLMAWADAAVSGGGSTCLELAFMQLPTIILTLADNQRLVAEHLNNERIAVSLGDHRSLTPEVLAHSLTQLLTNREARTEMAALGRALVDGEGAHRVVRHLRQRALRLRRVGEGDSRTLWEWANDPEVRDVSFSSESIPWEEHTRWFRGKLGDPRCFFYLALDAEGRPVGQIRFDIEGPHATISVSLERGSRRLGYGRHVIDLASKQLFAETPVESIIAYVKADNYASAGAFAKAGYVRAADDDVGGKPALKFVLQRGELERLH